MTEPQTFQAQRQLGLLLLDMFEEIKRIHDESSTLARKIARANLIYKEMTGINPAELRQNPEPPDFEC